MTTSTPSPAQPAPGRERTAGLPARIEAMSRRPKTMGAQVADDVVSLAMGEPSEGTPAPIVEAAVRALRAGRTRYTALTGAPELREALARFLSARHHRELTADRVLTTHGGSAGLAAAILTTIDPGDRVVIPEPTYSLYADHVAMAGGEVKWVANRPDLSPDVERIEAALPGARMLVLCSPNNPTGAVISNATMRRLSAAAAAAGAYLVCDEAYADIVFDGVPFSSALDLPELDHVICAQTFSKSYAMTGWRLGYLVVPADISPAVNLVHRTFNGAVSTFIQDAGVEALRLPAPDLEAMARSYERRRDMVVAALGGLPQVRMTSPQGAFYAFVYVDDGSTSDELVDRMAQAGVLVRAGTEFGPSGEGAFRISFAAGEVQLGLGLKRIAGVLQGAS